MSADDPVHAGPDGATQQSAHIVEGANEANAPTSKIRLLNRPLLFTSLLMLAIAALLVTSYFLPWSHLEPSNGQPWPPGDLTDGQPLILWNAVSQNPSNTALMYFLLLMGPPTLYAICSLLGLLAARAGRIAAGVLALLVGIWCVLTTWLLWLGSGFCDCAASGHTDIGGWFGITASLLMPIVAIVLLNQKGKLFARIL